MQNKQRYSTDNNMFHILLLFLSLVLIFDEIGADAPFKLAERRNGYTTGPELISIVTQPLVLTGSLLKEVKEAPIVPKTDAAYVKYGFQLVVSDPKAEDSQLQVGQRDGDLAQRQYTVFETDDSTRPVELTDDEKNAFNAVVFRSGLWSEYGAVEEDAKAYTIGVARGGNQDWVNRRRTTSTTTESPEIITV